MKGAKGAKGVLHLAIVGSCRGLGVAEENVSGVAVCSLSLNLSMRKDSKLGLASRPMRPVPPMGPGARGSDT